MNKFVEVKYSPPLSILSINRPRVLNAYNEELLLEFKQELQEVLLNKDIEAVIITGKGSRAFSVGADIYWLEDIGPEKARDISSLGQEICDLIEQSSRVVIAAVNGYALGGGMELTLACDLRIASTRARFGQPEVRLGLVPCFDGTQRLPQLIGAGRAKEMLFTGNIIDASQALEIGLVNKVVTPRDLLDKSRELAYEITNQSSEAVKLVKDAINFGLKKGMQSGSEFETKAFEVCFQGEDHQKRIKQLKKIIQK